MVTLLPQRADLYGQRLQLGVVEVLAQVLKVRLALHCTVLVFTVATINHEDGALKAAAKLG